MAKERLVDAEGVVLDLRKPLMAELELQIKVLQAAKGFLMQEEQVVVELARQAHPRPVAAKVVMDFLLE
jgi:hypothetical protein